MDRQPEVGPVIAGERETSVRLLPVLWGAWRWWGRWRSAAAAGRLGVWAAGWSGVRDGTCPAVLGGSGVGLAVVCGWRGEGRWAGVVESARTPGSRRPRARSRFAVAAVRAEGVLAGVGFAALRPPVRTSLVDLFTVAGQGRPDAGEAVRLLSYPSAEVAGCGGCGASGRVVCFAASDADAAVLAASGVGGVLSDVQGLLVRDGWVVVEAEAGARDGVSGLKRHMAAAEAAARGPGRAACAG
ncbi:MAG: hypothetical protein ACK4PI_14105 [Tepidisphaerales bacterium]